MKQNWKREREQVSMSEVAKYVIVAIVASVLAFAFVTLCFLIE